MALILKIVKSFYFKIWALFGLCLETTNARNVFNDHKTFIERVLIVLLAGNKTANFITLKEDTHTLLRQVTKLCKPCLPSNYWISRGLQVINYVRGRSTKCTISRRFQNKLYIKFVFDYKADESFIE